MKNRRLRKGLFSIILMVALVLGTVPLPVFAEENASASGYSATFSYNGKTYSMESITGTTEIQLSTILTPLEITGTVMAASVSEDQGMTVNTSSLTLTKAFGSGWLKVTVDEMEYQIIIESLPNSISVVLYGTLFFDKNGGSGEMTVQDPLDGTKTNAVSVREYSNYTLPECGYTAPDGYEFSNWEINGIQYNVGETYAFGQTTTAKAIWSLRDGVHNISASYESADGNVIIKPTKAVQGENVMVTVQPSAGKTVDSISYSFGETYGLALSGGENGIYTFSMPDEDTTVSVTFKDSVQASIPYIDNNGSSQSCNNYSYVRSDDTAWSGWVVASQNMTLNNRVTIDGTVNLILMDGKTLTVTNGIRVTTGNTLNIYAQSTGNNMGELIAGNKSNTFNSGIGSGDSDYTNNRSTRNAGNINFYGGRITAYSGSRAAAIGGGSYGGYDSILIKAGDITAYGNESGAGIGSGYYGEDGPIYISGGTVNATGGTRAAGIGSGQTPRGEVQIEISGGTITATGGASGSGIGTGYDNKGGRITISGGTVTATGGNGAAGIGCGSINSKTSIITISGTANVTAQGKSHGAGIGGCSEGNGEIQINITGGIVNASAAVNNGAAAIGSGQGAKGKTTITISGGTVEAHGDNAYGTGIGGGNTGTATEEIVVNILGGSVTSTGRVGIGTANASEATQTINISGGTITATGSNYGGNSGAAIGQGNNSKSPTTIKITGGRVTADGTGNGIGAGANSKVTPTIKLRWTGENDEYTAIGYLGNVTLEKSFINKTDASDVFPAGVLTDISVIANKTLIPTDTNKFAVIIGDISYGSITPNPWTQAEGQTVTLTIQPAGGGEMNTGSLSVTYTDGSGTHTVTTTQDSTDPNKYTFTMPAADVNVTATFTSAWQKLQSRIDSGETSITLTGDVVACDGESALQVPAGRTVTIDLNGHKIDRHLAQGIKNGYVMEVRGSLTICDNSSERNGMITGGNHKGSSPSSYGGGIRVQGQGIVTLESGSITGNTSEHFGGGVSLQSTSKFYMNGGSVTGNTSMYGAGIAASDNSTVSISGGTISGNTASYLGGGLNLNVDCNFIMTGGEIKNNTAVKGAGGINYVSRGAIKFGGSATVTDNSAGGKAYNVHIPDGKTLTIESALTGIIGVTTVTAPTGDKPVRLTSGLSGKGNAGNFTSDNDVYSVVCSSDGEAELLHHTHCFNYSASGWIIEATCICDGECPLSGKTFYLPISAPDELTYNGTTKAATITGEIPGVTTPSIVYKQGDTVLDSAPINAGRYTASITVEGKTASLSYTIEPRPVTITAANQSVELNGAIAQGTDQWSVTSGDLVSSHSITSVTLTASSTAEATMTGTITPSAATIKDGETDVTANYAITYENGTLTVTDPTKCFVTFEAGNEGTGSMVTMNVTIGETYTLPDCTFTTPEGKVFKEWSVVIGNSDAVAKNPGDEIEVTADTTVTAVWATKFMVNVIAKDTDGNELAADITGNGKYFEGTKASLSAKVVEGYNFKGWYLHSDEKPYYTGNPINTTNNFEYTVEGDAYLTAVYEALGKALITINCEGGYTVNGSEYTTQYKVDNRLGTKLTLVANGDKFAYWENGYGMVLSRSRSYTVTVTGADTITAVFDTVATNKATLVFKSYYDQIMARIQLASGETMELPSVPYRNGYTAQGWDLNGDGKYDDDDTLDNAITRGFAAENSMIVINPVYVAKQDTFTITVNNGTITSDKAMVDGKYVMNSKITVTADAAPEGQKFSHWTDGQDETVSYNASYQFFADRDLVLTAVYVADTEIVEAKGTTEIISMSKNIDAGTMTFVSLSTVPEGFAIKKAGLIITGDEDIANSGDGFNDSTARFVRGEEWSGTSYRYTWTITGMPAGVTAYARGYLVYVDKEGNTHTIYGTIVSQVME